jgi:hypothetical protein
MSDRLGTMLSENKPPLQISSPPDTSTYKKEGRAPAARKR